MKTHLKLNKKALCGTKQKAQKLKFASNRDDVTCKNCLRATER